MAGPRIPIPRGKLKIYLGYAAGVGKTYKMLDEGQELKRQGVDVVIGYFESHGRQATIAKAEGLETVGRRKMEYRGTTFEEMDTDSILRRRPQLCLVDEFAHTNVPGSERAKRWEDVQLLLDAGINVITTMNVQHLESLNDQILQITNIRMQETVPDWVTKDADEVVMVDLPPEALLNRLKRGVVYPAEKADRALQHFFKESNLVVLREMALRQTAHELDVRHLSQPANQDGDSSSAGSIQEESFQASQQDRILIFVTPDPLCAMLIRRGRRVADYLHADCFAVCVQPEFDHPAIPPEDRAALERHMNFARNLHIETQVLEGQDAGKSLVEFARQHQITQIFVTRPSRTSRLQLFFGKDLVQQVVRLARDMQVTVVADRRRNQPTN
jgi:two-component system, OmpR family, sensor histidine kinase KdpD